MNLEMRLTPQTVEIVVHLHAILDNDFDKVYAWLKTKNPMFGNISPLYMINTGRAAKVLRFIEDAEEGNLP